VSGESTRSWRALTAEAFAKYYAAKARETALVAELMNAEDDLRRLGVELNGHYRDHTNADASPCASGCGSWVVRSAWETKPKSATCDECKTKQGEAIKKDAALERGEEVAF
jgi:hypothetical protein